MTIPTPVKSWQFANNQQFPGSGSALATNRAVLRWLKNTFKGFALQPWTVWACCDSINVVNEGVSPVTDNWLADSNLVWTGVSIGTAHSWIVLRQTGIAPKFEICISLEGINELTWGRTCLLAYSPAAGFGLINGGTDGTTTARPTALDEVILKTGTTATAESTLFHNVTTTYSYVLHVLQSTDGEALVVLGMNNNYTQMFWAFGKPSGPTTGWLTPAYGYGVGMNATTTHAATLALLNAALPNAVNARLRCGSTVGEFYSTCPCWRGSNPGVTMAVVNDVSGEWWMMPVGIASEVAGCRGIHGQIFDLWWGSQTVGVGDTYPNDLTRQFAQFYNIIVPWNGTVPLTA